MRLGIAVSVLILAGYGLLTWAAADLFGPLSWRVSGGLLCLLVALAVVGWRFVRLVFAEGIRGLWGQ